MSGGGETSAGRPGPRCPAIPGFEVVCRLSSGGMGDVLLARRQSSFGIEKLFAIKTIREDRLGHPEFQAMLLDEARLLSRLDHPAIAQIFEFGESDGVLYLVMEYVAGVTFRMLLRALQRPGEAARGVPPAVAARLTAEACWGLHAAHELSDVRGRPLEVVHRDVSPPNLILAFSGSVKVLDFGIALMCERSAPVTRVGLLKGKLPYMAPEQRRGERIDRRADVYAAALVLYELLTGVRAVDARLGAGDTPAAAIPPPSALGRAFPADLDEAVMRGLAPDPGSRYPDARTFALALEDAAARLGGVSLREYASTALAGLRAMHDEQLRALLAAGAPGEQGPPTLRPRGATLTAATPTRTAPGTVAPPGDVAQLLVASAAGPAPALPGPEAGEGWAGAELRVPEAGVGAGGGTGAGEGGAGEGGAGEGGAGEGAGPVPEAEGGALASFTADGGTVRVQRSTALHRFARARPRWPFTLAIFLAALLAAGALIAGAVWLAPGQRVEHGRTGPPQVAPPPAAPPAMAAPSVPEPGTPVSTGGPPARRAPGTPADAPAASPPSAGGSGTPAPRHEARRASHKRSGRDDDLGPAPPRHRSRSGVIVDW